MANTTDSITTDLPDFLKAATEAAKPSQKKPVRKKKPKKYVRVPDSFADELWRKW